MQLPHPLTETGSDVDCQAPFGGTLPSMKGSGRLRLDHRTFIEQVRECMDNGYLLSSKRIGSGTFSKVYLAYATQERMRHNPKLSSDLQGKHHTMVAIKIVSMAEAPVEFSQKFLPREVSSLNATYKHLNVVQLYETYQNSQRFYLVLELAARGDLLEHINAVSDHRHCPGLGEEEARRLFWQLISAVAHCHNAGIVHRDLKCENILLDDQGFLKLTDFGFANHSSLKNSLLSTFCGSVAYTAPEILMSKKYSGEQADLWSLGIILYAMVTGKLPFKESQPHRMLHLMRRGPTFQPGLSPVTHGLSRTFARTEWVDLSKRTALLVVVGMGQGCWGEAGGVAASCSCELLTAECRDLIRGLLHLHPCSRLDLQQVASHRWMLPAVHTLFCSVLGATSVLEMPEGSQLLASQEDAEPGVNLTYPRRQQQQHTWEESASGLALRPPEVCPRQEAGSAGLGLQCTKAGSPGVSDSKQSLSLCSTYAIRSIPGHYLVN